MIKEPMPSESPLVEMKNVSKYFPGIVANYRINFKLLPGEIHALLGENGAGKSTLMNILAGIYIPDEGEIYVEGKKVNFRSPQEAIRKGIGMVHQHFMLIKAHSALENVILSMEGTGFFINEKEISEKIQELSTRYNLQVDPFAKIWQLSVGEQQRIELLKALIRNARILILDEPTAVLTPHEVRHLFKTLRDLKSEGRSAVFISHKLEEVMQIADRITILREGQVVETVKKSETCKKELARLMVGREVFFEFSKSPQEPREEILKLDWVKALNDKNLPALNGINFTVRAGEIMGIAGVAGNGQKELAEVLFGLRKVKKGEILFQGKNIANLNPRKLRELGISYIPEDRIGVGLAPSLDFSDNLILANYWKSPFTSGIFLDIKKIREWVIQAIFGYDIKVGNPGNPVQLLSGGNQQKLLLARELYGDPKLIITACPTRGLDVAATENARKILIRERDRGAAVLLISEDLEEIFQLSDKIAVIYEGQIMGILDATEATLEKVSLMMGGISEVSD